MRGFARIIVGTAAAVATLLVAPAAAHADRPPALAWSPTTISGAYHFGTLEAGTTDSVSFTLTNSGGSATGRLTVTLSGSSAFTTVADSCSGRSLGPRKSCTVTVQYAPAAAGQSDIATLTASGKKAAAHASLVLTGASGLLGGVTPTLTLEPGTYVMGTANPRVYTYDFGAVAQGVQLFTVSSDGTAPAGPLNLVCSMPGPQPCTGAIRVVDDGCTGRTFEAPVQEPCLFRLSFQAPANCSPGQVFTAAVTISDPSANYILLLASGRCA